MNKNRDFIESISAAVRTQVEKDERILAVLLLGSAARGDMRPDSDIDLALMAVPGDKTDVLERSQMAGELSYELARSVDVGEISSKNLVYAREALLKGTLLFCRDIEKFNLARVSILGMYLQFNLDRKEILDAYRA
jgi:predicted nucleotidyltransferase